MWVVPFACRAGSILATRGRIPEKNRMIKIVDGKGVGVILMSDVVSITNDILERLQS